METERDTNGDKHQ